MRMGRPRESHKDLPPGFRHVAGRWYWRPTDAAARAVCDVLAPGKASIPAGASKAEARAWWVASILPRLDAVAAPSAEDSVASIIDTYLISRKFIDLAEKTKVDYRRNLALMRDKFGTMRFATSDTEAARGACFRRMHIANHLDQSAHATAANRQVAALSSAFALAIRQGRTEYNPCRDVERNSERPRDRLISHSEYAKLKHAAPPIIRIAMLLARLTAIRESDLLSLTWHQIKDGEIHIQPSKTMNTSRMKQRIRVTKTVRLVLGAARTLRGNLRSTTVLHNSSGQPYTQSGFQTMWQRTVKKAGVPNVHFHDLKAKAVTDAERKRPGSGTNLAAHTDPKTTRKIYQRGAVKAEPSR